MQDAAKLGSFIYTLDSEDSLVPYDEFVKSMKTMRAKASKREKEMAGDAKGAEREGEKIKGDYGMAKAKINSNQIRIASNTVKDTGSILIILKQSRQNVNPLTARFADKTRNGGVALTYYNANELWFSIWGKIRKRVMGKERRTGFVMRVVIRRNSQNGKVDREVLIPFYDDYGVDDLGACVLYLVNEKHWGVSGNPEDRDLFKKKVTAPEFKFTGTIEDLAGHIEISGKQLELQLLTTTLWQKIENECRLQRKPRYE